MIRFESEDSDPYTQILIYDGDEVKSTSLVAFPLNRFESWLKGRMLPQSVKEAESMLNDYDEITKKQAHDVCNIILGDMQKGSEKSYTERLEELKTRGYSDNKIHADLFPEEYDFMYDDHVDTKLRRQGINPMSKDYMERVNKRRVAGGFSPLDSDECYQQSMEWVQKKTTEQKHIEGRFQAPEQADKL